jgi:hypothetical protein
MTFRNSVQTVVRIAEKLSRKKNNSNKLSVNPWDYGTIKFNFYNI